MAYAAIISLKQTLQQILIHPYVFVRPREKKHIESFHKKLEFLQRFLEEHASHASNEKVTFLERRIRDASYEAEDFMDLHLNNLCNSAEIIWQMEIEPMMKQVDSIIGEVTKITEQMGLEIKPGRGSFVEEEIKTGEFGKHKDFEPSNAFRKDSSSASKNLMMGFDDYLLKIKDQLTGQSSALEVISVVGMGGIGKTTLATHIYNDPSLVYQFDVQAWASVSQSYSVRDIMLGILDSMKKFTKEMHGERDDQLKLQVYQNLKHRRYLIIIDDIWDTIAWDYLKIMFPDDDIRSRIMLTTRIDEVAAHANPSGTLHQISLLSDDQSWELLCAKVFEDEPCPLNLQKIGKTIARKCRGLPLSIVVIGGLLSKVEKTRTAWQPIAENVTSIVFSSDDQCSGILRLSYNYLPQYLKACFLYMGVFPKSHEIHVSKLTKMWVAEGFLRQAHGQSPEEVAESCVEDLLGRSLILVSRKNYEGKIHAFRIHDLLLDFCVKEAKYEKFLQITESPGDLLFRTRSETERRMILQRVEEFEHCQFPFGSMSSACYVRSLVFLKERFVSSNWFLRFKLLRVLDATEVEFREFPSQVLKLVSLRYIALIYDGYIPASITKLWNLQTLIIARYVHRKGEEYLPREIWIMAHLRHLSCDGASLLNPSAAEFNFYRKPLVLEDLQTLTGLKNQIFTMEILQSIPNIKNIDVVYDYPTLMKKEWADYKLGNLRNLHQLKALIISVIPQEGIFEMPPSMFKFQFPPSLKTLSLVGVKIPWHDLSIIGSLPNLEVLEIKHLGCLGTEWEPNEEEICKLKVLVLEVLDLKHWRADSDHFPSLKHLIIRSCNKLVEIPSGIGESATLATIELSLCKDSVWASANEILEKQLSDGNDGFQVINMDPKPMSDLRGVLTTIHSWQLSSSTLFREFRSRWYF